MSALEVDSAEGLAFGVWARIRGGGERAELQLGPFDAYWRGFGAVLPWFHRVPPLLAVTPPDMETIPLGDIVVNYGLFMAFRGAVARPGVPCREECLHNRLRPKTDSKIEFDGKVFGWHRAPARSRLLTAAPVLPCTVLPT